jgi:hypothetical protein
VCLHRSFQNGGDLRQPFHLCQDQAVLVPQLRHRIAVRVVKQPGDVLEPEPELPVRQDPLQPGQVGLVVTAVAHTRADARAQQTDPVVVVQGPHRHPGQPGHVTHRPRVLRDLHRRPPSTPRDRRYDAIPCLTRSLPDPIASLT